MEYAPATDYPEENINFMSIMNNTTEFSNIEPVCVHQGVYDESIKIKGKPDLQSLINGSEIWEVK